MSKPTDISVGITLGGGIDLAITKDDHLVLVQHGSSSIDLGKATEKRFDTLIDYLGRLKIHAITDGTRS